MGSRDSQPSLGAEVAWLIVPQLHVELCANDDVQGEAALVGAGVSVLC